MCLKAQTIGVQSKISLTSSRHRWKSILIFIITGLIPWSLYSQKDVSTVEIPTLDMRDRSSTDATYIAIQESGNDVIVVLIRGGSEQLTTQTTGKMKALYHKGFTRIGIVLSDLNPGETSPVLGVIADKAPYAIIKKAKPDDITAWKIFNLVQDAYQEFVCPKVEFKCKEN